MAIYLHDKGYIDTVELYRHNKTCLLIITMDLACTLSRRFQLVRHIRRPSASYFRFLPTPGRAPIHNPPEQARRFVVLNQCVTQRTRSPQGRQGCAPICSAVATSAP